MADPAGDQPEAKSNIKLVGFFVVIAAAVVALPTIILLGLGLIPTFVAFKIDPYRRLRYATRCVGSMNLTAAMPYVLQLWGGRNDVDAAFAILGDPMSWMVMFGGAAVGWGFYLGLPSVVQIFLTMQAEQRVIFLTERQQKLVEEWGEVITTQQRPT
ncbi:MAG: hypothetical protein ISR48_00315 [Alphaproteobacteria bacterium]|nr:hypothetical protein [Alphaproteobacteria bacterium]